MQPRRCAPTPPPPPSRPRPLRAAGTVPLAPGRPGPGGSAHHLCHRPQLPRAAGTVLTVPHLAGVGRCPLANGHGCLLGYPSARCIAGPYRHCRPRKGRAVGQCPGWRGGRGWIATSAACGVKKGTWSRAYPMITGASAGPECCVHRIASSVRPPVRWPGIAESARILHLRVASGPRAVQVGRPSGPGQAGPRFRWSSLKLSQAGP